MEISENVYDALKILLKISQNAQDDAQVKAFYDSPLAWLKEYCTVRAATARRGGHTESILKLMEENGMHLGCIFNSYSMKDMFEDLCRRKQPHNGRLEFCISNHQLNNHYITGKKYRQLDALVVDNSFLYSKKEEDKIYELASILGHPENRVHGNQNKYFFLIFLQ